MESIYRSPIYSHFSETINGISTVRAYNKVSDFCYKLQLHINNFMRIRYLSLIATRWLSFRLEFVGNCIVFFAALFGVLSKYFELEISAGLIGLSVSYSLMVFFN